MDWLCQSVDGASIFTAYIGYRIYNPYKQVYLVCTEGDHFLHFTRTPDGTLTDISATGGPRVHLQYDNPLGRLTDIKRVVNNEAVETLITT